MKSAWPTSGETTTRLDAYGLTLPTGYTAQNAIDDAVATWEELVGFTPFLASSSSTYKCDPTETQYVHLPAPFGEITAVTQDGNALTINADVFPGPSIVVNEPYKYLYFNYDTVGDPGSIVVTGKLGWLQIPNAVWNAVLELACGIVQGKTALASGEISKVRQESVSIEYVTSASGSSSTLHGKTMETVKELAMRYRI